MGYWRMRPWRSLLTLPGPCSIVSPPGRGTDLDKTTAEAGISLSSAVIPCRKCPQDSQAQDRCVPELLPKPL